MITGLLAPLGATPIEFLAVVAKQSWLKFVLRMICEYQSTFKSKEVLCSVKKGVSFLFTSSN